MGPHGVSRARAKSPRPRATDVAAPSDIGAPHPAPSPQRAPRPLPPRDSRLASRDSPSLTPLDLYELTVQNPRALLPLLLAIHAGDPKAPLTLAEDFCGSAALSRYWVATLPRGRAIATDVDPVPLDHARRSASRSPRLKLIQADLLKPFPAALRASSPRAPRPDIVFVGNFSIGEIHARPALVRYLRSARARLAKRRGVFICDTYGGASAYALGAVQRTHPGPPSDPSLRIRYTWEQREANPLTARVVNALHFRVMRHSEVEQELTDAFIYRWRLWSIPELRDAMAEAGFTSTAVYAQLPDAQDSEGRYHIRPLESPEDLEESYIVCVAARA